MPFVSSLMKNEKENQAEMLNDNSGVEERL